MFMCVIEASDLFPVYVSKVTETGADGGIRQHYHLAPFYTFTTHLSMSQSLVATFSTTEGS